MHDAVRFRLLRQYQTPRFRLGQVVLCAVRGFVRVVRISPGRIAWPVGAKGRARSHVVYQGLERALRHESSLAVCHWWGVAPCTVAKWRRELGIQGVNPGESEVRRQHFLEPWAERTRQKAWAKARDPERRRKIAASRKGKARPPHVIEAMTQRRSDRWTAEEDALIRTLPPGEAIRRTVRSAYAVYGRRKTLSVTKPHRRNASPS